MTGKTTGTCCKSDSAPASFLHQTIQEVEETQDGL